MSRWPMVALGDVLTLALDPHPVAVDRNYPNLGIYSFGRGTFHKQPIEGNSTSATTLYRIRTGQFIYSRLFAFEGAYSVVAREFDGYFVSNEFPTFDIDRDQLDASYVRWLFTRPSTWASLASGATGMGDRRQRIHPEHVLSLAIPLPPLPEQRRIAAKLDAAAEHVAASRHRLEQVMAESLLACRDLIRTSVERGGVNMCVGDVMRRRPLDITVQPEQTYEFAGVYSFGRGVFRGESKSGSSFAYSQLTQLRVGDFTYPKLMAWEGALGVVPQACDGLVVSPEFPVFQIDADTLRPEIADVYFRDPRVWPTLSAGSTGTNMRRRRLNPSDFLDLSMPVPSHSDQEILAGMIRIQRRVVEAVKRSLSDLDTLLPALLAETFSDPAASKVAAR